MGGGLGATSLGTETSTAIKEMKYFYANLFFVLSHFNNHFITFFLYDKIKK